MVDLPPSSPVGVGDALQGKVRIGYLQSDPAQRRASAKLQRLQVALKDYDNHEIVLRHGNPNDENDMSRDDNGGDSEVVNGGALNGSTIGKESGTEKGQEPHEPLPRVPRGMYIHGEVGTGKSLLMDLFFETAPIQKKQRFHFHEFLSVVHRRIHRLKQHDLVTRGRDFHVDTRQHRNPVYRVAAELANEVSLLCLDEFQVTDIADAMILSHLFSTLFSMGVVLVATSNRSPNELYEDGLNRSYFLPFIDVLKRHCVVHDMGSTLDYRLLNASSEDSDARFFPTLYRMGEGDRQLDDMVDILREGQAGSPLELAVPFSSRHVYVPSADESYRVGRFHFADLCDQALGASDFRAVATAFDCVAIDSIPVLSKRRHNLARRFITLVDELYEARTPLLCSAEAVPASRLFLSDATVDSPGEEDPSAALASVRELSFAFRRAASRLEEMTSRAWWNRHFSGTDVLQIKMPPFT